MYVLCSKTYISDFTLYIAMQTKEEDLFYQPLDSADWSTLLQIYSPHEFPDNKKVVKAYKNFY